MESQSQQTQNVTNQNELSQHEKFILQNKEKIITLNENSAYCVDVTEEILQSTEKFSIGEMIHTDDFTLEETMNSVELNHYKMDSHYNYTEANTYKKLLKEGKIKKIEDLSGEEVLALIDNLTIKEMMWMYGNPIYQTIFTLVYFTDDSINRKERSAPEDGGMFRVYLDSTLHILYLTYSFIKDCSCLREEDISMVPIHNIEELKRSKVNEELQFVESNLRKRIKSCEASEKKVISALINRFKIRRELLKLLSQQFDFNNESRYDNLIVDVNSLKDLMSEVKADVSFIQENIKKSENYFCEKLCRINPAITSIKLLNSINFTEATERMEKFLNNLTSVSRIYDLKDFYQILKSIELLNSELPSFLIRCILELNLFPKGSNLLFGKIDYSSVVHKNLTEFKINFLNEESELISNLVNINKELLLKNLKNRTRQVRECQALFDGLAILVLEGNQTEKEIKKTSKQGRRTILTNLLLKQVLHEMNNYIWTSFELQLFAPYELDYIFYVSGTILDHLSNNTNIIAGQFAEKILREEDFVKSNSKRKLNPSQKMVLDEIHIFNGLKYAIKGITLICKYLKVSGIIKSPPEEYEKLRIANRFPVFKNCKYFLDFSYESFMRDTDFDLVKEKDMLLQSADSNLKLAIKYFNELKGADLKLRDAFNYSNTYIDNLSKAVISNNLLISKIKKMDKKGVKLNINTKKYPTFLPILELA